MRVIFTDRTLPELPAEQEKAWSEWLTRQGLDADRILCGHPIYCDDADRSITCTYIVMDEDGNARIDSDTGRLELTTVTRHLEAPALPCPPGLRVTGPQHIRREPQ